VDHHAHPAAARAAAPSSLGPPEAFVWYVDLPSPAGFPNLIRLPLGVVPYAPPAGYGFLSSSRVPDFLAADIPPEWETDPLGALREYERLGKELLRWYNGFGHL